MEYSWKKIAVIAGIVWFIVTRPNDAAAAWHKGVGWLEMIATGLGNFMANVI